MSMSLPAAVLAQRSRIEEAADFLRDRLGPIPTVALILGSGLGSFVDGLTDSRAIAFDEIPHWASATAPGHAGRLVVGQTGDCRVIVLQGRLHGYEGHAPTEATFPIRVLRHLGVKTLVVTCAAGSLHEGWQAGDLMLISDQINLTGTNPLVGPNDPEIGPRFPVMFDAYRERLRATAREVSAELGLLLREGVYAGIQGPSFLTPAELAHLITIGGDAVGMSVVHEVLVAVHGGLDVVGLALLSDVARPDEPTHATAEEVLAVVERSAPRVHALLASLLPRL